MKVLTWDLETAPNLAHTWGLWDQNVGLPQLLKSGYVLCFAAKWEHEDKVRFHKGPGMALAAWKLLDEADVVVSFNGLSFDTKWMHSEFVRAGYTPPSPYAQVDLCRVVKQQFRFPSNKLEYVASELLGEGKQSTGGHQTWIGCMNGDRASWAKMRGYNEADVLLTERLYQHLKPWIRNLPNASLYDGAGDEKVCGQCGSDNIHRRGLAYTTMSAYVRYQCQDCGRWGRGKSRVRGVDVR